MYVGNQIRKVGDRDYMIADISRHDVGCKLNQQILASAKSHICHYFLLFIGLLTVSRLRLSA
jgi:hypothetical protein